MRRGSRGRMVGLYDEFGKAKSNGKGEGGLEPLMNTDER